MPNKKPKKYGSRYYHRVNYTSKTKNVNKTTTASIKVPRKSNTYSRISNMIENYKSRIYSEDLFNSINCIDELVNSIENPQLSFEERSSLSALLLDICGDNKLNEIVRIKALKELKIINFNEYIKILEHILSVINEKISFKIQSSKIIDNSINIISQGNSYVIKNSPKIVNNHSNKAKSEYFIDPRYFELTSPDLEILVDEINNLYKTGNNHSIFPLTRTLLENFIKEILYVNFPQERELWRMIDRNGIYKILKFSQLITNLFTKEELLNRGINHTYQDTIDEYQQILIKIKNFANQKVHNTLEPTDGETEEFKDLTNRIIPFLRKLYK